jgi:hypothetical protein
MRDRWAKIHDFINPNLIKLGAINLFALLTLSAGLLWLGEISYVYPGPAIAALILAFIMLPVGWVLAGLWQVHNIPHVRVLGLELLTYRWQEFKPKAIDSVILHEQTAIALSVAQLAYQRFDQIRLLKAFPGAKIRGGAFLLQAGPESPLVLKFDSLANITAETERYRQCVARRLGQTPGEPWVPPQRYGIIGGQIWGAITYALVGPNQADLAQVQTFGQYYLTHHPPQIETALAMIFESLTGWWANRAWQTDPCAHWRRASLYGEYDRLARKRHEMEEGIRQAGYDLGHATLARITSGSEYVELDSKLRLRNPLNWIREVFEKNRLGVWSEDCRLDSIVHGDFHANNILVSEDRERQIRVWVIDFPHTHVGPTIQDMARLEADLKIGLLTSEELMALGCSGIHDFETSLLPDYPSPPPLAALGLAPAPHLTSPHLQKTRGAVQLLRHEAREHMACDDARPYYLALLHATLPMFYYRDRTPWQKLYAFISAALLCERLGH